MSPEGLSEFLRTGDGLYLWCRSGIMITSLVAGLCMIMVRIYQIGPVNRLAEAPLPRMDADKAEGAPQAYHRMSSPMPGAMLGLLSYMVTAALVSLGGTQLEKLWWVPLVVAVKVAVDAVQAGRLSWEQRAQHQGLWFWCVVAAAAALVAVPLAIPEAYATVQSLVSG